MMDHDHDHDIAEAAGRHGLSGAAARVLFDALGRGGGWQAQFSHPDLGGMGQWSGGMTQIGDMFNDALKAKIAGFCDDMASVIRSTHAIDDGSALQIARERTVTSPRVPHDGWWPAGLGRPGAMGSQDGNRYACFPMSQRLAVERDGVVTLYDTGDHRLTGFAQQQSDKTTLSFASQHGPVELRHLKVVQITA